ncbi:E3 ubiquitin-protein ligase TRIM8a [Lampris incognitus]|uniref:E3 ubiquitin-protein ligase TRIM8a n=1 Tax=Lampris incognitus TaxID=2546036 RepID=UPI0024B5707A|nr:E3 ubiquitin-protein ligase TRIM8a [Lampris incognitus]
MEESWKNGFEEELLCPICLNVFDEPIQLPCKHNFCQGCISEAWAKDAAAVRCPECNRDYSQKPAPEKNLKLANIVERFNALNTEKAPAVLHCVLCRRGPPLPVHKVCLRCKEPCCQSHVQTHLQQPCPAPGHLLVDVDELRAWSCPRHEEYRLFHCEDEQVAVCQFCCISRCAGQRHTVRDVDVQRAQMQKLLMRQQERLDGRVQNIDEQLGKLESDKSLVEDAVCELKERVRAQYRRMQALLDEDLSETLQLLENANSEYRQKNSQQALQLKERRQEADKFLSSAQMFHHRAENINFMKNTKPYQLLVDRSKWFLGSVLPDHKVGQLNSHLLLSELTKREQNLRKVLEEPLSGSSILQTVPCQNGGVGSAVVAVARPEKRRHAAVFPDGNPGTSASQDPPLMASGSKRPFLGDHSHRTSSLYPSEGLSQTPHSGPGPSRMLDGPAQRMMGLGSGSGHNSGTMFPPSHYAGGGPSQQAMLPQYGGRKILMCSLDNCCCSRVPAGSRPSYPASDSFPWLGSQEYPSHPPLSAGQQGLSMRDWMDTSQTPRHPDFYGLYGQSPAKHYVTS